MLKELFRCGTWEEGWLQMANRRFGRLTAVAFLLLLPALTKGAASAEARGDLLASDLRCEGLVSPLGIESPHAKLSWRLEAKTPGLRGLRQSAYQILVASA